ncbi:hypothetical protein A3K29_02360 [Candidatus Collierbacteria bacterium RIFOXYB2_FULL_46_14]|uniref:Uncharacterized protein n=1 Tax=Candidatus Collierbacteria bacterium GW2011_GWA2_46_26 TaxID=1618381 RepID=A0A0G1SGN5_9BACT|nr:MAG: hypothetical protein UW29_C0010G0021 [Candidatus Collierbacteria bacterium GW2011_GWC2_44_13]KKU32505.1 MAG: hypothetical protein UX47_C0010G0021 [Candidatus Collierbacteria bacterium GW2011_GWA2_46_26]OGD72966.1 MAG: hypothetical protein A3K29_02360 [Candidatus Collierbacteria bacterium RIFOXYB2_FULL_46_14]OGD76008.1 MAG: hypothetical protein A3K43_02360 [Candidatus Collierbacteria bacterium RIFOXYA2_FULL_46_20]OGD77344.1 MAG: hypothetical protein A3K39_02360 [Candidatus Collierbacteri
MSVALVPLSLLLLFFSKRWLTIEISRLVHRFGGGHQSLIVIWSVIFLPGTVIHEMSHFFFAIITGARTGKIEIFPEYLEGDWEDEEEGRSVALGYVQTQKLNPIQGFFVGTAPFIVGMFLLVWLASLLQTSYASGQILFLCLQGYLFFTVANSFFPSWSDIRQTLPLVIIALVCLLIAWTLGLQLFIRPTAQIVTLADTISATFLFSSVFNLLIIGGLFLTNKVFFRTR